MSKYLVETFYTCTFKIVHKLDELNEKKLSELENRNDGKFEIIDVKLNNRKTKHLFKTCDKSKVNECHKSKAHDWAGKPNGHQSVNSLDGLDCHWFDSPMLGHILDKYCLRYMAMDPRRLVDSIPTKTFLGEVVRPEPD